jgi:hypothetical protein
METVSSEGLMDGLQMTSNDTPAGISCLVEPILDSDGAMMVRVINEVNDRPVGNPKSKV